MSGRAILKSCTPAGVMLLLQEYVGDISGKDVLVIGRSLLFGKPAAQLLLAANATVTMAHSKSRDLPGLARRADIVVAAIGRPEFVKGDWIKLGATVIDVGINRVDAGEGKTRLVGDVDYEAVRQVAGAITPVPGGGRGDDHCLPDAEHLDRGLCAGGITAADSLTHHARTGGAWPW